MTLEQFLSWEIAVTGPIIVNGETGIICQVVSGFTEEVLKAYKECPEDQREQHLKDNPRTLWTRGLGQPGSQSYEYGGAGDIHHSECEKWHILDQSYLAYLFKENLPMHNHIQIEMMKADINWVINGLHNIQNAFHG